jgi:pilus assembly protein Flp/PilA
VRSSSIRFLHDDRGATAIEYGLIAALVALAAMSGINLFAGEAIGMWDNIASTIDANING